MKYAQKYGVSKASRKYNKARSYIYFWQARWDGSAASLVCRSRQPHSHPKAHTEAELKLIRDMRRRNPTLGMVELRPPAAQARLHPSPGEPFPGHAQAGDVATGQDAIPVQAQAL